MQANTIIQDAEVITMTRPATKSEAQAIAIGAGRILAVGANDEMAALAGPETKVLNLAGKTVLPGFIDSHVHFMQTGLGNLGPHVYEVTAAEQVLDVVSDAVARAARGEPVLVHGAWIGGWDRPITQVELDRLAPHNPVMIGDVGAHGCIVNSNAWAMLHLPPQTPGVQIDAGGEQTGLLLGKANTLARYHYYTRAVDDTTRVAALHRAAELALAVGITTVHALDGGSPDGRGWLPERDVEVLLREQANLPVRTVIYFQSTLVERAVDLRLPRIGGCLWVDGSYGEHTAALMEPYADDPTTKGLLYFTDEEMNDFVSRAHKAGLQISMHAIGDAAIEQLLSAYERVLAADPRPDHRHRIEHFSLPTADQIERVARLGVAVGMQPNFAAMPDPEAGEDLQVAGLQYLGTERYARRHPYRKIIDAGILVAGGSDSDPKPMGPLEGLQAVVNHPDEDRRLTVYEALTLYTINGAKIAFEETTKGTIEPGKVADLVVLGENPLTANPRTLKDITIEMTLVGGKVVYQAN